MFLELDEEFHLIPLIEPEDIIQKIIEYKCDREKMNNWINDVL